MRLIASFVFLMPAVSSLPAKAWNMPGHIYAAISYQSFQQESPPTIDKVKRCAGETPLAGERLSSHSRRSNVS
jgi:hypothetical protein